MKVNLKSKSAPQKLGLKHVYKRVKSSTVNQIPILPTHYLHDHIPVFPTCFLHNHIYYFRQHFNITMRLTRSQAAAILAAVAVPPPATPPPSTILDFAFSSEESDSDFETESENEFNGEGEDETFDEGPLRAIEEEHVYWHLELHYVEGESDDNEDAVEHENEPEVENAVEHENEPEVGNELEIGNAVEHENEAEDGPP